ncbi:GerAB/ArcD/ProY family transporter [Sporosarcina sp. FSL K6-1508]|uniref:GerAB/ArcD/ProY family transporter n=1 Tax=Sporosarcina sp. FSL K6-1508 TaxID=2921553 RepID=UPI0030F69A88
MMQNIKINSNQFLVLVVFFTIGTSILEVPSFFADNTKQDAWITAIIGTGIGLLVIWFFTTIALWFPQLTYVQINEKVFGKWIGKAASLIFIVLSLLYTSSLLFQSGNFLNTHMLPNTPMVALNILMVGILIMGVRLGLETIARSAEILFGLFFILLFVFVILIAPEVRFENLQPVFEAEPKSIVQSSLFFVFTSSVNAIVLLMIFPSFINNVKQVRKYFLIGNLIGGVVIIGMTFLSVSVLGADKTAREIYPAYELAKRISIGNFVQRIEALMAQLGIISLYIKMILYFYATVFGIAQVLHLRDYRSLTTPLGIIIVVLSLVIYPNVVYKQNMSTTTEYSFSLVVGILIPVLLVLVYGIRKKHLKQEPES